MTRKTLQIHQSDDAIVALQDLQAGEQFTVGDETLTLSENIRAKHKFALKTFAEGEIVTQYGVPVGRALKEIPRGALISTDNLIHAADDYGWSDERQYDWQAPDVSKIEGRTFKGYMRSDGRVGTANNWLVIPLVFCENKNVLKIREAFMRELGYEKPKPYRQHVSKLVELYRSGADQASIEKADFTFEAEQQNQRLFKNVDGIRFLTHEMGCGGTGDDSETLCGLLAGYCDHPNVAGVTVLSLGCQKAQIGLLKEKLNEISPNFDKPFYTFEQQAYGNEEKMVNDAIRQTFLGLMQADQCQREEVSIKHLRIGVECGGSDGFSGISANPCIGQVADMLVASSGSVILSEFPELCGVEQEMIDRCVRKDVADRFIELMRRYGARAEACGSSLDSNPSPGNIKDGLITDAIKSAGAARKGGSAPVEDVRDYPEVVRRQGLTLLNTPGNDVESTTALAGAGANLILFSTGLGTPTGNPVTPVIKVASNSSLAERMNDIIDFDSGKIISGEKTLQETAEDLLDLCIRIASGEKLCRAELNGQEDFIPWKRGVSL